MSNNLQFMDMSNALRFLSVDAVQQANSGHPGMPMGMACVMTVYTPVLLNFRHQILIGRAETVLCFQQDTDRCCCTPCFI